MTMLFFLGITALITLGISGSRLIDDSISGEKVGIIEVTGMIVDARDTIEQLKRFRDEESVKAIVLRIDSPGGGVGPSQEIYREIRRTVEKKKVIASMGSVAASGGYYIAAAADGIVANPGTITGSIGVIMGFTNYRELLDKIGLFPVVVKSGEFKDMGSPVREMTAEERQILEGLISTIHGQFVRDIVDGRNMETDAVEALADGRIYTGEQSLELGLVDRLGNLVDAVEWAGTLGGIEGDVSTVYAKERKFTLLEYVFGSSIKELAARLMRTGLSAEFVYQPGAVGR